MDNHSSSRLVISNGSIVRFFLIAILLLVFYYLSDVVLVILAAVVIASSIEPIIRRLRNRKVPRLAAVIMIYILVAIVIATLLVFFMPIIVNDAISFLETLPSSISLQELWQPISDIGIGVAPNATESFSTSVISLADLSGNLKDLLVGSSSSAMKTASTVFGGVMSFILIIVLSFYLVVQEDGVGNFLRIVFPTRHHDYIINLWKRSQRKIGFWLQGQIILSIIIGVLVYIILLIAGMPNPLALAVFAAVLEIIPVFGPIISSVPAILIAFTTFGIGKGFLVVGLYLLVHQLENHVFYPLVVKKVVNVSPIVVILALVVGMKLAGVLGAIIAVPLSAALMEYVNDVEKRKIKEKEASTLFA